MGRIFGYAGKLLKVNLSSNLIGAEAFDEATARKWLGGTGFGAKTLYDEVPSGVEWDGEANRLIIASGPLGGTAIGGSGTVSCISKGPLTNGAGASQANGFFGAFIRFCGYEGMVVSGKAEKWVYLYVNKGKVEVRDASHLIGKDTWETSDLIRSELGVGEHGVAVASIGPAGENLVKFATIFFDKGHTASKNGLGAVMGAKRLKAIAVARGGERPALKDAEGIAALANEFHENNISTPAGLGSVNYGTLNLFTENMLEGSGINPVKNYMTDVYALTPEKLEQFGGPYIRSHYAPKPVPCYACRHHHCHMLTIQEGPYKGFVGEEPEYECFNAFAPMIGSTDVPAAVYLSNINDRLGMDCNEMSWVLGLALECFEKGVINSGDTDNINLTWGNIEAVNQMMHRIALRQGFGDILAEGAMRAAQRIGGEAPNFAIHTMKGNTPRGHDDRNRWQKLFDTCISQMSTDEGYSLAGAQDLGLTIRPNTRYNVSPEDTLSWNVQCRGGQQFEDSLGVCRQTVRTNIKLMAKGVALATGWDFTPQEGMEEGRRIVNLLRCFNLRHGHTAAMDAPSPRYGLAPVDGPSKGKTIMVYWDELRSKYYEAMGWDKNTGKPLPDTLRHFGLDYAVPEIWGKKA